MPIAEANRAATLFPFRGVTIELAAGNHLTLPELRRVITSNGFSPKEATVVVEGTLDHASRTPSFRVDGTNETFTLARIPTAAAAFDEVTRAAAQRAHVEINGRVDPPKGQEQLAVGSVKPLPQRLRHTFAIPS